MNFFFDRCLPIRLARMIGVYEVKHIVRHLDDDPRFHEQTGDVEWMRVLSKDDPPWIVISADLGILRNRVERAVLREANLTFFCLKKQWMKTMEFYERAWRFLKLWPEIISKSDQNYPRIFEVSVTKIIPMGRTRD
jgi:hypothetical protein